MEMEVKYLVNRDLKEVETQLRSVFSEIKFVGELDLPATYFDTEDLIFEKNKMALRIRKEQGKWMGCFKGATPQERVFVEEEIELSEEECKENKWFTRLDHYSIIRDVAGDEDIQPRVKINTRRRVYLLHKNESVFEVVLDWVSYLEGAFEEKRLEVELKKGNYAEFTRFVGDFVEQISGLIETSTSKYKTAVDILRKHT